MRTCSLPRARWLTAAIRTPVLTLGAVVCRILEHPLDSESLRWVGEDAFEIISNDGLARHALSPSWDFRSCVKFAPLPPATRSPGLHTV